MRLKNTGTKLHQSSTPQGVLEQDFELRPYISPCLENLRAHSTSPRVAHSLDNQVVTCKLEAGVSSALVGFADLGLDFRLGGHCSVDNCIERNLCIEMTSTLTECCYEELLSIITPPGQHTHAFCVAKLLTTAARVPALSCRRIISLAADIRLSLHILTTTRGSSRCKSVAGSARLLPVLFSAL